jgi:transcriptional regulator with XRE-family HTH domain
MGIGARLREERELRGMSQSEFAALAGVHRKSQENYEADRRQPDADYLAALSAAGADVLYILTGERGAKPAPSRREAALLDNYEHLSEEDKRALERLAFSLAEQKEKKEAA